MSLTVLLSEICDTEMYLYIDNYHNLLQNIVFQS